MPSTREFESVINDIYDHLYAGSSFKTPAGISREVSKILYLLRYVEDDERHLDIDLLHRVSCETLSNPDFVKSTAQLAHEAFGYMISETGLFDGESMSLSDFDIVYCLSKLSNIEVSASSKDVIGDALEVIRSQWTKRIGGQFFTDQLVTSLAMHLIGFDPSRGHKLIDACAGTGGFLLAGIEAAKSLNPSMSNDEFAEMVSESIFGQEIDAEVAGVANATVSSKVPSLYSPVVFTGDSLKASEDSNVKAGYYSHAATNPPFGSKITVKDPAILENYELALKHVGNKTQLVNRAPDILFMEQNIKMLKPGVGKLAIVTPYQQLSGPQARYVRDWILRNAKVLAVIDLPADTFQPHTGTKASLLILQRREEVLSSVDEITDEKTFIAVPRWIGHDRRGNPVYAKNPDGSESDELLTDLPEVSKAFDSYLEGNDPSDVYSECSVISSDSILSDCDLRLNGRFHQGAQKVIKDADMASARKGWGKTTIGECSRSIFYPGRFKRNYVEPSFDTVPFFGGTNISQLCAETSKYISVNDKRYDELAVHSGWILVTRSGSCGVVSTVTPEWDGCAISEHVIRIVVSEDSPIPAEYLQLYLRSDAGQAALASGVFGSVIDEITPEHIAGIVVPVPPKEVLDQLVDHVKRFEAGRDLACKQMRLALSEINSVF